LGGAEQGASRQSLPSAEAKLGGSKGIDRIGILYVGVEAAGEGNKLGNSIKREDEDIHSAGTALHAAIPYYSGRQLEREIVRRWLERRKSLADWRCGEVLRCPRDAIAQKNNIYGRRKGNCGAQSRCVGINAQETQLWLRSVLLNHNAIEME